MPLRILWVTPEDSDFNILARNKRRLNVENLEVGDFVLHAWEALSRSWSARSWFATGRRRLRCFFGSFLRRFPLFAGEAFGLAFALDHAR